MAIFTFSTFWTSQKHDINVFWLFFVTFCCVTDEIAIGESYAVSQLPLSRTVKTGYQRQIFLYHLA